MRYYFTAIAVTLSLCQYFYQADAATVVGQPTFGAYTTSMIGRLAGKLPVSTFTNYTTTGRVPEYRTVNTYPLSSNVSLSASDVGAVSVTTFINYTSIDRVPATRTVNSYPLSSNVTLAASDVGAVSSAHFSNYSTNRQAVFADTKDPTGFVDPDNISCSYDSTARTVSCTHAGGIEYYWRGVKHTLASPWTSSAHTNSAGRYFLYSADGSTFEWSTTAWTYDQLQVAIANYQTADKFGLSETHGLMPWQAHQEAHDLLGTYRVSGGSLTAGTYTENTATDAATTPGFDVAVIKDEDVSHTVAAWSQGTYTTLRIGASSVATFDTTASFPFRSSGSYILVNDPATGAETAAATNQFVNVYQVMIPATSDVNSQKYRMVMLQPQKAYTSLAAAQAEDSRSLALGNLSSQSLEYVVYARITYVMSAGDANTGKCRIATGGVTYITGSRQGQTTSGNFIAGPSASATYIVQTADTTIPNAQAMGALATGIVKNTTTTGVLSIAAAGDFPTLNQSTTGSAATLTTARTINGVSFNGSANIQTATASTSDYTASTFTPVLSFGGGTTGITYTARTGRYTKIGNRVFVAITILLSSKGSSTGAMEISGLPIASSSTANNWINLPASMGNVAAGLTQHTSFLLFPSSSLINVYKLVGGSYSYVLDSDITDTAQITITGTYEI